MVGIYKIENTENGRVYVGKSKNIMQRWATHEQSLQNGTHHSKSLQEDYNIFGMSKFDFAVLEICDPKDLNIKEKEYQEKYNALTSGYNTFGFYSQQKSEITLGYEELSELCQKNNSILYTNLSIFEIYL